MIKDLYFNDHHLCHCHHHFDHHHHHCVFSHRVGLFNTTRAATLTRQSRRPLTTAEHFPAFVSTFQYLLELVHNTQALLCICQHCLKLVTSTWVHLGTFWVLSSTYWCSRLCCCHRRPLADSQRSDTACQNISTAWEGAGLLYHRHRHHHRHCRHYHYCRHRQHHQRHHHCLSKY